MEHQFTIRKMTIIDGRPNHAGNRLLASMEMTVNGIQARGFLLIEKKDGRIVCNGSKGKTDSGQPMSMFIEDHELRAAIVERASMLYSGFTGRQIGEGVEA